MGLYIFGLAQLVIWWLAIQLSISHWPPKMTPVLFKYSMGKKWPRCKLWKRTMVEDQSMKWKLLKLAHFLNIEEQPYWFQMARRQLFLYHWFPHRGSPCERDHINRNILFTGSKLWRMIFLWKCSKMLKWVLAFYKANQILIQTSIESFFCLNWCVLLYIGKGRDLLESHQYHASKTRFRVILDRQYLYVEFT